MMPIADRSLGYLCNQHLCVTQQQIVQYAAAATTGTIEFLHQEPGCQPVTIACILHSAPAGSGNPAHEKRNAEHALIAHSHDFSRFTILQEVVHGQNGGRREIDMM